MIPNESLGRFELPHPDPLPKGEGGLSVSRALFFIAALVCSSCRDEAAEAYARAELKHRALIEQGARPEDPRFEPVLADFRKVTASSKHAAAAQKLIAGIEAGRKPPIRTPLALAANGRRPPRLEAQLAACAQLAVLAGADGGVDHPTMVALEKCRREAEALELQFSHPEEYEDGGHP